MFSMGDEYGHDATFVEDIPEDIKCSVCHLVLREPMQLMQCGHRFCSPCFGRMKRYSVQFNTELCCPNDREKIDLNQVFKDTAVARMIANLHVKCCFESNGCDWLGDLRDLKTHEGQCCHQVNQNHVAAKGNEIDSINALLKQMSERLHKCEENILAKDKEMAYVKYNLHEMKEKVHTQNDEINLLKLKNIELEKELKSTNEVHQQLKDYVDGEITILNNSSVENKKEIDCLKTSILKLNEAQQLKDGEIKSLKTQIKELNNKLDISIQSTIEDKFSRATTETESLRSHLDESMNKIREEYNKLNTQLTRFEVDICDLSAHVENTENQVFNRKLYPTGETIFVWKIQHFKYHSSVGERLYSPTFCTKPLGHLCRLTVQWGGFNNEILYVYFQLCRGRDNKQLEPFRMNIRMASYDRNGVKKEIYYPISLVDQHRQERLTIPPSQKYPGMGYDLLNVTTDTNYIIDDSLTIVCILSSDSDSDLNSDSDS